MKLPRGRVCQGVEKFSASNGQVLIKRETFMFKKNWMALATTLLLASAIVSLDGNGTAMAGECKSVKGRVVSQLLTAGCASPVGLCTIGRFSGDVRGEFVFTATSLS